MVCCSFHPAKNKNGDFGQKLTSMVRYTYHAFSAVIKRGHFLKEYQESKSFICSS
jgi:hypothetical protein